MTSPQSASAGGGPKLPPQGRYPVERSAQSRRRWFILLTVGVVVLGLVIAWIGYQKFSDPDISGSETGYQIIDSSTIEVKFTVNRKNSDEPGTCIIRARSKDGSETGRREVYIPASNGPYSSEAIVHTYKAPGVGDVFACSTSVPDYLKPSS
jgi:hypothetical protein